MTGVRGAVGGLGVLAGLYGAYFLLQRGWGNLYATAQWLVAGVVLHDFVLAPLTIVLAAVALRVLPGRLRPAAAVVLVIVGTVTVMAIPVLGRFGARSDNATLLDRSYWGGWVVFVAVVLVGVAVWTLLTKRSAGPARGSDD